MRSGEFSQLWRSAAISCTASLMWPARISAIAPSQSGLCAGPLRSPPLLPAISARKSATVERMRGTWRGSAVIASVSSACT